MSHEDVHATCASLHILNEPGRLLVSRAVSVASSEAANYQQHAIVPADPLPCDGEQLEKYTCQPDKADMCTVMLVPGSAALKRLLVQYGTPFAFTRCEPNMRTTTQENGQLVGLHVDNHDKKTCATRMQESTWRFGYNAGPGDRYVLVGSASIVPILKQQGNWEDAYTPGTEDFRGYAQAQDVGSAILWLLLHPGDGYVAQTELLAHDGSTYRQHQPSIIYFWLDNALAASVHPLN